MVADVAQDLYDILEVDRNATADEIKKAYRRLARELHPDTNPDPAAEARFKEISAAYEVLSDPERRSRYDTYGDPRAGGGGSPFDTDGGLGDLFDAFFSQMSPNQGRRGGPVPGHDMEVTIDLALADAAFGAHRDVSLRLPVPCGDCEGSGAAPGTEPKVCADCAGSGEVRRVRQSLLGQMITASPCPRCGGVGQVIPTPCPSCRGDGRVTEARTFTVEVPAGVEDGTTLRLAGRGAAGPRGGPAGSLYVHLQVTPDPRFERRGDDLHTMIHVGIAQAAIGTRIDVETLEAAQPLAIQAGTQSGTVSKIKGQGVTHLRGRGRGDLYVHIQIDTPTELSDREVELLAELAAIRGEKLEPADEQHGIMSKIRSAFH